MAWASALQEGRVNPNVGNVRNYDGTPITMSFYMTSVYVDVWMSESPTFVKRAWRAAYNAGHEIANHTHNHNHGAAFTPDQWGTEVDTCTTWLTQPFDANESDFMPNANAGIGVPREEIYGFRTPFLEYNQNTLATVLDRGFWYDCSIEEGFQIDQDGRNFLWPYTLDGGSPGHDILVSWGLKSPIAVYPGLWELPVHAVIVPPDDACERYGVPSGLRTRLNALHSWFDVEGGKITGFDYNLWVSFAMSKAEFLATLKYTLDLRLEGNRAPFMFGTHSDYYSSKYTGASRSTPQERREAIEEFLDYALTHEVVRVVSHKQILDWVRNPSPL
jgi:peptidoglycan/xylan/chitin deacetylase (PgdA/CDA1 family)